MANEAQAKLAYDGNDLADGSMDAREFAAALVAVNDLVKAANRVVNADAVGVAVRIEADFQKGSFGFKVGLAMFAVQQAALFVPDPLATGKQLLEYLGLTSRQGWTSLIGYLKKLKGATPSNVVNMPDGQLLVYIAGSNNTVTVSPAVFRMSQDPAVRKAAAEMVRPLKNEGVDKFIVKDENDLPADTVVDADLPAFEAPAIGAGAAATASGHVEAPREVLLEVVKPSFQPDLRWLFNDGASKFGAYMRDTDFMDRVTGRERTFGKGDVLRAEMRTTTRVVHGTLEATHEIVRVISEFNAAQPGPRLFGPPGSNPTSEGGGA